MQSERIIESGLAKREVVKASQKMKCGKVAEVDSIAVEFLKEGCDCDVDWLVTIFNVCMGNSEVRKDWQNARIVPPYKGKGKKVSVQTTKV